MPILKVRTNVTLPTDLQLAFMKRASKAVALMLGKPERYVMISLDTGGAMLFAGEEAPLAYLELKSIGLPDDRTREFSSELCRLVSGEFDIPAERIYIEFTDAPRSMWGWNGAFF